MRFTKNKEEYAAYYKSLVRGVNPDAPTGLDAWIKL